jgi:hypothetical protein
MLRQTPALVTSAAHIGPLRESTRAFSSFVTPDNYGHVMQSSAISNRSHPQQALHYTHATHIAKNESDDSVHNWVRLPTMPADTTTHVTYPSTSYVPGEAVVNELRRTFQGNDGQKQQRNRQSTHYPPQSSQDPEIEEQVSISCISLVFKNNFLRNFCKFSILYTPP